MFNIYARAKSILRKNENEKMETDVNYIILTEDITFSLVKVLLGY